MLHYFSIVFQSTHPGWGATDIQNQMQKSNQVSIHAPRVGCDVPIVSFTPRIFWVSIHAPRVGCDCKLFHLLRSAVGFQSTHPGWGATSDIFDVFFAKTFQSTHPGWGATSYNPFRLLAYQFQSTHPGWGATLPLLCVMLTLLFQSTHPGWGAT